MLTTINGKSDAFIGYSIMFMALVMLTVVYSFIYFKRVVLMAFLTMIAPLVAVTYPLDKANDGTAQGFNMWFKEYMFNLLLQPMHLLLYVILIGSAIEVATENLIWCLVVMMFMTEGEDILRRLFNFQKASTPGRLQGALAAGAVMTGMNKLFGRRPPEMPENKEKKDSYENGETPKLNRNFDISGAAREMRELPIGETVDEGESNDERSKKLALKDVPKNILNGEKGQKSTQIRKATGVTKDEATLGYGAQTESGILLPNSMLVEQEQKKEQGAYETQQMGATQLGYGSETNAETTTEEGEGTGAKSGILLSAGTSTNQAQRGTQGTYGTEKMGTTRTTGQTGGQGRTQGTYKGGQGKSQEKSTQNNSRMKDLLAMSRAKSKVDAYNGRKKIAGMAKNLPKRAFKFAGRMTIAGTGAMVGLAAGVVGGDYGKAATYIGAGALAGGKFGASVGGKVGNMVTGAVKPEDREDYKKAWMGEEAYQQKQLEKYHKQMINDEKNIKKVQEEYKDKYGNRLNYKQAQEKLEEMSQYYQVERGITSDVGTMIEMEQYADSLQGDTRYKRDQAVLAESTSQIISEKDTKKAIAQAKNHIGLTDDEAKKVIARRDDYIRFKNN